MTNLVKLATVKNHRMTYLEMVQDIIDHMNEGTKNLPCSNVLLISCCDNSYSFFLHDWVESREMLGTLECVKTCIIDETLACATFEESE